MTKKLKALEVEMYPERYAECMYIPNPVVKKATTFGDILQRARIAMGAYDPLPVIE